LIYENNKKNTNPFSRGKKNKIDDDQEIKNTEYPLTKKAKLDQKSTTTELSWPSSNQWCPLGLKWSNQSCAFDAALTPLLNIYIEKPDIINYWKNKNQDPITIQLIKLLEKAANNPIVFEQEREQLRRVLNQKDPRIFPIGENIAVSALMDCLFISDYPIRLSYLECKEGHQEQIMANFSAYYELGLTEEVSIADWFIMQNNKTQRTCKDCRTNFNLYYNFINAPPILVAEISGICIHIDEEFTIDVKEINNTTNEVTMDEIVRYKLKGVIYYKDYHFTSRLCDENNNVYYHDGIETGTLTIYEGKISDINFSHCRNATASIVMYVKE
jgi:hypothetical protein